MRRTLAPLREVAGVAQEVTNLELDKGSVGETARVPERLTDERTEVGQVGASLNSLLGHVEQALDARHKSEQQVRQFVADASHELRTPLTAARTNIDLVREGRISDDEVRHALDEASVELDSLTSLVSDLVELARGSERKLRIEEVQLDDLVAGMVERAKSRSPQTTFVTSLSPVMNAS